MKKISRVVKHLSKDPIMAKLVKENRVFEWIETGDLFEDLVTCIIGQQLSVKAARSIGGRFKKLVGKITPKNILKHSHDELRGVGLSNAKVKYILGLAEAVDGKEIDLEKVRVLSDEEVMEELVKIKGVGPWSAEMIMIFTLGREDIFSIGDLGLRNSVAQNYGVDRDDLAKIKEISQKWSPYRSYASRYLWESLDNV